MIRREHGQFVLRSRDGRKVLGRHPTRAAAEAQERAVEAHKHTDRADLTPRQRVLAFRRQLVAAATARAPKHTARPLPPNGIVLSYTQFLNGLVRAMNAAVRAELRKHGVRFDAEGDAPGTLVFTAEERKKIIAALRRKLGAMLSPDAISAKLDQLAARTGRFTRAQFAEQLSAALGISLAADPDLAKLITQFRTENVNLISTMSEKHIDRVERVLIDNSGARVETIARALQDVEGVSARHAALIARDQVLSLNSRMTEARHVSAGISSFKWSTSLDDRVRDSHAALEGLVFTYADGAPGDDGAIWPGRDYQCRCINLPNLPELTDDT